MAPKSIFGGSNWFWGMEYLVPDKDSPIDGEHFQIHHISHLQKKNYNNKQQKTSSHTTILGR